MSDPDGVPCPCCGTYYPEPTESDEGLNDWIHCYCRHTVCDDCTVMTKDGLVVCKECAEHAAEDHMIDPLFGEAADLVDDDDLCDEDDNDDEIDEVILDVDT
jgi:hypothetical protein